MAQLRTVQIQLLYSDEQVKIAKAVLAMDTKIAAVQAKVDKMLDFKQGLLQQMLV